jgi:hypothetical protein
MQTILTGLWARSLERELADVDARQLLDIGLVRAEDGSLRVAHDPSVAAVPPARRLKRALRVVSWVKSLAAVRRPSRGLKTAR